MERTYTTTNMKVLIVLSAVVAFAAGYAATDLMQQASWTHSGMGYVDHVPYAAHMPYASPMYALSPGMSDIMMRYRRDVVPLATNVLNHHHMPVVHTPVLHTPVHQQYIHEGMVHPQLTHLVKRGAPSEAGAKPPTTNHETDRYPQLNQNPETNLYTNKKPSGEYASSFQKN